jgi:hypothetical protein
VNEQAAGPGQLTCIDDHCARAGFAAPESMPACAACGGPVGRVPSGKRDFVSAAVAGLPGTGSGRSRVGRRLAITIPIAVGAVLLMFVIRNPDVLHRFTGTEFSTGDCVHVKQQLIDYEMERTECTPNQVGTDPSDQVYRVESVQDTKDGHCPPDWNRITFSNEPEDTTYCLVLTS